MGYDKEKLEAMGFGKEMIEVMEKLDKDWYEKNLKWQNLLHAYITAKINMNPHWEVGQKVKEFIDDDNIIIDNEPPYLYAYAHYKDANFKECSNPGQNLDLMVKSSKAQLKKFVMTGTFPERYYFERVAILAHKQKDYQLEIDICEMFIFACDTFNEAYAACGRKLDIDVRDYIYYKKMVKRLEKAQELLAKQ